MPFRQEINPIIFSPFIKWSKNMEIYPSTLKNVSVRQNLHIVFLDDIVAGSDIWLYSFALPPRLSSSVLSFLSPSFIV